MKKVGLKFKIPVSIIKEGKSFVAYSPALDLSSSAGTFEKAGERFGEAACLLFEELIKKGTLEQVLSDLGWKKIQKKWNPPVVVAQDFQTVCL